MTESADKHAWRLLKSDKSIQVFHAQLAAYGDVLVKQYRLKTLADRFRFWLRVRRVSRFYHEQFEFVPALLHAQVRERGAVGQLCYQYILGQDLRSVDWQTLPHRHCLYIGKEIGRILSQLHSAGWVHGDCKFGNFLVATEFLLSGVMTQSSQLVVLVDNEAARRPLLHQQRAKARDLARLLLNALERQAPKTFISSVWQNYAERQECSEAFKREVKQWLLILAERHQKKYGVQVDISELTFL